MFRTISSIQRSQFRVGSSGRVPSVLRVGFHSRSNHGFRESTAATIMWRNSLRNPHSPLSPEVSAKVEGGAPHYASGFAKALPKHSFQKRSLVHFPRGIPLPAVPSKVRTMTTNKETGSRMEEVRMYMNRVTGMSTEDLVAFSSGFLVIAALLSAPMVYYMRQSDSTYEGLDTDDPILDLVRIHKESRNDDDEDTSLERILTDFLSSQSVQHSAITFVVQILESQQVKDALQRLVKQLWDDLVSDPETVAQVVHLLQVAIQDEAIKAAAQKLVLQIVDDREVMEELVHLLRKLGRDNEVLAATEALLVESAHNTLNNREILDHSMEFATDVVDDDFVQRSAGEALRNTLTYAIRPAIAVVLASTGAGLLLFSIFSLGYARSSEQEAKVLDEAISGLFRSLESSTVWSILKIPVRGVGAILTTSLYVAWAPFRMVQSSILWIGYTGKASYRALNESVTVFSLAVASQLESMFMVVYRPLVGIFAGCSSVLGSGMTNVETAARSIVETSEGILYWFAWNTHAGLRLGERLLVAVSSTVEPVVHWIGVAANGTIFTGKAVVNKGVDGIVVVYEVLSQFLNRGAWDGTNKGDTSD